MSTVPIPQGAQIGVPIPPGAKIGQQENGQPGFLDREIPLDSTLHATESGLQSIGRGVRDSVRGIGTTLRHPIDTAESLGHSIAQIPSTVAQIPAAIHDINQSPDPLGTYAKVGQETAGQGAGQALTALATEGIMRAVPKIATPMASRLYQSALKPSTAEGIGNAEKLVQTGLDEKIPVSAGGAAKLNTRIGDVNNQIADTIAKAPSRTINKVDVASRLRGARTKALSQVNPEADLKAIGESGDEFLRNQPDQIPGPAAQALKQGTYRALGNRAYGELKGATVEAQKSLARGLKEELANQYPELNALNATDSRLINLHDALEKAAVRGMNREPFGMAGPMIGSGVKIATGSTPLGVAAYALKEALRSPVVRSKLAIALNGVKLRGIGGSLVGASAIASPDSDQSPQR